MKFKPKTATKLATVALATTLMAGATAYADSVDVNTVESGVTTPTAPSTATPSAPSTDSVTTGNTSVAPTTPSVDTVGSSTVTTPSTDVPKDSGTSNAGTTTPVTPTPTTPTEPTVPEKPTTPSVDTTVPETPATPVEPVAPTTPTTPTPTPTEPTTPTQPTAPSTDSVNSGKVETPVQPAPPTVSTAEANQNGQSQVGTQSVTGQIVRDVTPSNPVVTDKGDTITNIQGGVATLSSGEQANLVDLGATKNSDRTYTVTNNRGEKETLPETGEKSTGILTAIGAIVVGFALSMICRKKANRK